MNRPINAAKVNINANPGNKLPSGTDVVVVDVDDDVDDDVVVVEEVSPSCELLTTTFPVERPMETKMKAMNDTK